MALHWLPEDGTEKKPARVPRPLAAIRAELTERHRERAEVWDGDGDSGTLNRESWLSTRIGQLLDEMLEHPDYVKVPC